MLRLFVLMISLTFLLTSCYTQFSIAESTTAYGGSDYVVENNPIIYLPITIDNDSHDNRDNTVLEQKPRSFDKGNTNRNSSTKRTGRSGSRVNNN
jgi:hypothetical protein